MSAYQYGSFTTEDLTDGEIWFKCQ